MTAEKAIEVLTHVREMDPKNKYSIVRICGEYKVIPEEERQDIVNGKVTSKAKAILHLDGYTTVPGRGKPWNR